MTLRPRWPQSALLHHLEVGLHFVPLPDWWETAVFADYLYSTRIMKVIDIENQYNLMGYRDTDGVRVCEHCLLGDSRTFGLFVEREETYAETVERMGDWQSLNLGVPGATTFEALDSMVPDADLPALCSSGLLGHQQQRLAMCPEFRPAARRCAVQFGAILLHMDFLEGAWHFFFQSGPRSFCSMTMRRSWLVFQSFPRVGVAQNIWWWVGPYWKITPTFTPRRPMIAIENGHGWWLKGGDTHP